MNILAADSIPIIINKLCSHQPDTTSSTQQQDWKIQSERMYLKHIRYIHSIFVPPSQSNVIAKKSAFKPKRGNESTTGIHLIYELS